jgi:hypothetical protein
MSKKSDALFGTILIVLVPALIAVVIGGVMLGLPNYNVWRAGLRGQGKLKEAEQEKLIIIETAKAEVESAKLRAEAIATVGAAVQQYPEYRQQEFIQIIYVPTEANIPIVENR